MNIIIVVVFFLIGYATFFLNPYKVLDHIYLPLILFFTIVGIYLVFSIDVINNKTIGLFKFSTYLFGYLSLFLLFLVLYSLLRMVLLYSMDISITLVFVFYVVIMSLIYKLFVENSQDVKHSSSLNTDDMFNLVKYLIFYIPCLFSDTIDYFIEDAKKTNKTTYILGLILIVLVVIYIVYPYISNINDDGILLIDHKTKLNETILSLTLEGLDKKIKVPNEKEGFQSLSDKDLQNRLPTISIPEISPDYKWFVDFFNDLKYDFFMIPKKETNDNDKNDDKKPFYTYEYGLSFFLYLESNVFTETSKDKAFILSFGSRPSMFYDYRRKQLIVEMTDYVDERSEFKQTRIYYSSNILFQKWNHIVMNYVNGQFDLFINDELVATQSNVSPYIHESDVLQVGSIENTDLGGISQLKYYVKPLSLEKIKKITY